MNKRLLILVALCAAILVTACIDTTTKISIRKDGSGTLTEIVYMNESVKTMMQEMMGGIGQEEEKEDDLLDVEKFKKKASKLGAGVKFVSAKEVTNKAGARGIQVVYSFDDVRKLNIKAQPDNPMGDEMAGMMGAESAEKEEDEKPITFDFVKGSTPKLIIKMPQKDEPESADESHEVAMDDPAGAEAGLDMMKSFLEGFRIRIMVDLLEGKIRKTNASFVEGKEVTLFDVNFGEIFSNEDYLKEFQGMSEIKDMNTAMEKMKNIPGLKIETSERVEISFK